MITTVTLNPCNDKTVAVPHFIYGGLNRVSRQRFDLAGKGFNVARGVCRLGGEAVATGFLYEENGLMTQMSLEAESVQVDCVWKPGSIRTNLKIFDEKECTITEVNEPGIPVVQADLEEIFRKTVDWAKMSDFLVLSGSLPPGAPKDTYAKIIEKCRPYCKVVLDAEGEMLLRGIKRKPYMIKPNRYELEMAVNTALPTLPFLKEAAMSIIREGVEVVVVSLGGDGAMVATERESYYAPAVKGIEVKGTVGAGDSMLAGLCVGMQRGLPLKEVFRMGVAAATSCVTQEGTALVEQSSMERYLKRVEVETL